MLLPIKNPYWQKHNIIFLLLIFSTTLLVTDLCFAMQRAAEGAAETSRATNFGAIPEVQEEITTDQTSEKERSTAEDSNNLLTSTLQKDKAALFEMFPHLKDVLIVSDKLVQDITGKLSLHALIRDPRIFIANGFKESGYLSQLKALDRWLHFWPWSRDNVDKIIRHLAMRPTFCRRSSDAVDPVAVDDHNPQRHQDQPAAAENELVKMVEMLKKVKWHTKAMKGTKKVVKGVKTVVGTTTTEMLSKGKEKQQQQQEHPATGMKWRNQKACEQVAKLVNRLNEEDELVKDTESKHKHNPERREALIALLTDIYKNHQDVLSGKSYKFPPKIQKQVDSAIGIWAELADICDDVKTLFNFNGLKKSVIGLGNNKKKSPTASIVRNDDIRRRGTWMNKSGTWKKSKHWSKYEPLFANKSAAELYPTAADLYPHLYRTIGDHDDDDDDEDDDAEDDDQDDEDDDE